MSDKLTRTSPPQAARRPGRFEDVNDKCGHQVGDEVLILSAALARPRQRQGTPGFIHDLHAGVVVKLSAGLGPLWNKTLSGSFLFGGTWAEAAMLAQKKRQTFAFSCRPLGRSPLQQPSLQPPMHHTLVALLEHCGVWRLPEPYDETLAV